MLAALQRHDKLVQPGLQWLESQRNQCSATTSNAERRHAAVQLRHTTGPSATHSYLHIQRHITDIVELVVLHWRLQGPQLHTVQHVRVRRHQQVAAAGSKRGGPEGHGHRPVTDADVDAECVGADGNVAPRENDSARRAGG